LFCIDEPKSKKAKKEKGPGVQNKAIEKRDKKHKFDSDTDEDHEEGGNVKSSVFACVICRL